MGARAPTFGRLRTRNTPITVGAQPLAMARRRRSGTGTDVEDALDHRARALERLMAAADQPVRWRGAAFVRELGLVRSHLGPIRNRAVLASSFGRESIRAGGGEDPQDKPARDLEISPVHVAYALRWLELGDGVDRPAWLHLLSTSAEDRMASTPNRSNARARRAELLSPRGRAGRRATERTRPSVPIEHDRPDRLAADAPPSQENDASLWFG